MSYEQSHTVGKKTKPVRKRKNPIEDAYDQQEPGGRYPALKEPRLLELQDHRSNRDPQPLCGAIRNDARCSDNAPTVAERLRSPESSDHIVR